MCIRDRFGSGNGKYMDVSNKGITLWRRLLSDPICCFCNPNSVFYNGAGNFNVRYSGSVIVIAWNADTYIGHITINNEGAYT